MQLLQLTIKRNVIITAVVFRVIVLNIYIYMCVCVCVCVCVTCNWVDTHWQEYSTHLHTENTQNNTINLGRVPAVQSLCDLYPGICLATEEKARKNVS